MRENMEEKEGEGFLSFLLLEEPPTRLR